MGLGVGVWGCGCVGGVTLMHAHKHMTCMHTHVCMYTHTYVKHVGHLLIARANYRQLMAIIQVAYRQLTGNTGTIHAAYVQYRHLMDSLQASYGQYRHLIGSLQAVWASYRQLIGSMGLVGSIWAVQAAYGHLTGSTGTLWVVWAAFGCLTESIRHFIGTLRSVKGTLWAVQVPYCNVWKFTYLLIQLFNL